MKSLFMAVSLFITSYVQASNMNILDVARSGNLKQLQQYIHSGGALDIVNHKGHTPFILATYYNHQDIASLLLANGANACTLDAAGNNAFMGVAFKGHLSMAKWLLDNTDCSINHRNFAGQTALMMAALFDQEPLVELFIKRGADIAIRDYRGNSAETLAAGQGLDRIVDIVRFSLDNR